MKLLGDTGWGCSEEADWVFRKFEIFVDVVGRDTGEIKHSVLPGRGFSLHGT